MYASIVLLPLLLASYVSAHGFVHSVAINGQTFTGNRPSGQRNNRDTIIRQVRTQDPIKGARNPDVNCGAGSFVASDVADANPGDTLAFDWRTADLSFWPHNTGPMITYLADCGNVPCSEFDSTKARWFKIHQVGKKPNGGEWFQADLMQGGKVSAKLPENIRPGNYLVRHEIIALHLAQNQGGAEFYAACTQLRIGGSGTGVPTEDELVSFPGAYSDNDAGILVRNVFDNRLNYQFPGPAVSRLAGTAAPGDSTPSTTKTSSGSKPTSTSSSGNGNGNSGSSGPKKTCRLKKNASKSAAAAASTGEVYPRHISRVMRRLAFEGLDAHHSS
ncbi:hypothetical protein H1R20_g14937, partial [Candolleomyces eurysporus]